MWIGAALGLVKPLIYLAIPSLLTVVIGVAWTVASNYGAAQAAIQRAVEIDEKNRLVSSLREESLEQESKQLQKVLELLAEQKQQSNEKKLNIKELLPQAQHSKETVCPLNCLLPPELFSSD